MRQIDLATLRVPVKRLTKVFAFDVNLFWVRDCKDEVALLHERVLPGGSVNLFFDTTRPEQVPEIIAKSAEALTEGGFRVYIATSDKPPVVGIIGRRYVLRARRSPAAPVARRRRARRSGRPRG